MTLWLFMGFGAALLGGLVFFWFQGRKAGADSRRADDAESALKGISDAVDARDDSRTDPDKRDSLRDKYRNGG